MKTYEFTLNGRPVEVRADNLDAARKLAGVPAGQFPPWRVVPTAAQIQKTKNLLRSL